MPGTFCAIMVFDFRREFQDVSAIVSGVVRVVLGAVRPGQRRHDWFHWRHGHADGPQVVAHHPVAGAAQPERTPPTSAAVRA